MPWGDSSPSSPSDGSRDDGDPPKRSRITLSCSTPPRTSDSESSWGSRLIQDIRAHFSVPHNWIAPVVAAALAAGAVTFYQTYLRRFPGPAHIDPGFFRRRTLLGKVTSVGDGDGFHMFHTPGGHLAGWGWLRRVPTDKKELRGRTISVRIAGVDAPEGAHFGRPAQPYAAEALSFLESFLLHQRVRARIWRRDQYERVVATVYVRRPPFFRRQDVGLEMLRRGFAVTYEGKIGAEFGGPEMEARYRQVEAEARKKRKGLWALRPAEQETPMEYKRRIKALGELGTGGGKV
ncbi:hypothetical protein VTJ83DRAFT_5973 [Remersonia thermophila]|uniref:Probable endonuclease LCL3 n=1 Tax=Remersonia thermophila TaxID=72144 RepID=A0ABR4D8F2_9PEZI